MPTLEKLNTQTMPVVLLDGDDPFIGHILENGRTRTKRIQLEEAMKDVAKKLDKSREEITGILKEVEKLDLTEQIEAKRAEIERAQEAEDIDVAQLDAMRADLKALEEAQKANEEKAEQLVKKVEEKAEGAEKAAQDALARQLSFFIGSTNMTVSESDPTPVAPTAEFWMDNFDRETLEDFVGKVQANLSGPLAMRGSTTK